jgi:predicted ATPase/class 3 adenylate cyclase
MTDKQELGERRLAAIMFTDIVGYTSLTEKNESLSLSLLNEYRRILRSNFGRFNGREIDTIGDGTLAEFPSALQAVQCAYEIQTNLLHMNETRDKSNRILIRIGIHIGDVIHTKSKVFGDTVNIASRIQSVSEPGGISVSEEIYRQVRNKVSFTFESQGEPRLKNVEHPLEIFKVVISNSVNSEQQNQVYAARFLNQELPFTDRVLEIQSLKLLLDKAETTKQGSVVFISGEPGIGKSRLADEVKKYASTKDFAWLTTTCTRSEDSAPYSPWIQLLREFANRAPTQLFYKICGPNLNQIVRLIPELAESSGASPLHPSLLKDPSQEADTEALERRQFYQALTQFFAKLSKESRGLVLHFDDLQWADQATLQLLKFFISTSLSNESIIILASFREIEAKSGENPAVMKFLKDMDYERKGGRIELKRLEEQDVGKLLATVSGQRDVSLEFSDLIYSRTGGNPYFIAEVLKALFETHDIFANERGQWDRKPINEIQVPASIRALIEERVGRLNGSTRQVLQTASIMGDTFSSEIVGNVIQEELDQERLNLILREAISSGFVIKVENNVYSFADESVRDVLLDQVDDTRKVLIHRKIASTLEKITNENVSLRNEFSPSIAYHFLKAGEKFKALDYSIIAGERSASFFAHAEAIKHYTIAAQLATDEETRAKLLRSLGDEFWFIGGSKNSLDCWTQAAEIYERIGSKAVASDLYRRIGFNYHTPFLDKENSMRYMNKAISLLENDPKHEGWELAAAYINATIVYAWDNQNQKAREFFEKGRKIAIDSHSRFIESVAAYTRSWIGELRERDKILQDLEDAIKYLVETSNIRQASFAYAAKAGWYCMVKGASQETLRIYEEAMNYVEKAGVNSGIMALKTGLAATIDLPLGRLDQVRAVVKLIQAIAQSSPSLLSVKCYSHLISGLLQLYLGDLVESKQNLLEVTKTAKGFGNSSFTVQPYLGLGRLCMIERNYSEAEEFLSVANEVSKKRANLLSNVSFQVELLSLQIEFAISSKRNSFKECLEFLDQMKAISKEMGNEPWTEAFCFKSEGLIALNQMETEKAIDLLSKSAEIWARLGWLYEQARAKYEIANGYMRLGDNSKARTAIHEALQIFSSLGAKFDIEKCLAVENKLQANAGLAEFTNQTCRMTFDYLVESFVEDYAIKNFNPQSSGWRTLRDIAKNTGVPASSLYFRAVSGGSDSTLNNLLAFKIVEAKTFKGERGRGGEVTRYRISYDKNEVKSYADEMIRAKSEMLH